MRSDGKPRITCRGQDIYHFMGTSTFSEYSVLHAESVAKVAIDAPLDKACCCVFDMFCCSCKLV